MDLNDSLEIALYSLISLGMCALIYLHHALHNDGINQNDAVGAVGEHAAEENV